MNDKEFYIVRAATNFDEWVEDGKWSHEDDPIKSGYHLDYFNQKHAEKNLRRVVKAGYKDAEILVFSTQEPYFLLQRINQDGVINC